MQVAWINGEASNPKLLDFFASSQAGKDYKYSHDFNNNFVEQEFLPDEIVETKLYEPAKNMKENKLREYLKLRWKDKYRY